MTNSAQKLLVTGGSAGNALRASSKSAIAKQQVPPLLEVQQRRQQPANTRHKTQQQQRQDANAGNIAARARAERSAPVPLSGRSTGSSHGGGSAHTLRNPEASDQSMTESSGDEW